MTTRAVSSRIQPARLICIVLTVVYCCQTLSGQEVGIYVSSKAGDRLAKKAPVHFEWSRNTAGHGFRVDDNVAYQTIDGFGASFLEAGMICLNSLEPSAQEAVLRSLFDRETGAGFSAMKTVIAGTDFMSA